MKKHYIQAISAFAIGIPILVALLAIIVILTIKSSIIGDFEAQKVAYSQDATANAKLAKIKQSNSEKKEQLEKWQTLLAGDGFTKMNDQLRNAIKEHNSTKTLTLTEQSRSTPPSLKVDMPKSACDFALQGTFSEIQKSLTQLECQLPNLMVNHMSLTPNPSGQLLELKINYTLWELSK